MKLLVTVGTTRFDALIDKVLSPEFRQAALENGIKTVTIQHGKSPVKIDDYALLKVECFEFLPNIDRWITDADVVIGHCGSGTILDVLRGPIFPEEEEADRVRPKLILVPNPSLMDNHQQELAHQMHSLRAATISKVSNLPDALSQSLQTTLTPLPPPNAQALNQIVTFLISTIRVNEN